MFDLLTLHSRYFVSHRMKVKRYRGSFLASPHRASSVHNTAGIFVLSCIPQCFQALVHAGDGDGPDRASSLRMFLVDSFFIVSTTV